jgi:Flp pilus assembly protein TadG
MIAPNPSSRYLRCLRFVAERRGPSVVEFVLLLPLMLTMYFGSIQITAAISADRQVTMVASTVTEITSQYTIVSSTDVSNILAAASAVLTPFPVANAQVTLSSVLIDAKRHCDHRLERYPQRHSALRHHHRLDSVGAIDPQYIGDLG